MHMNGFVEREMHCIYAILAQLMFNVGLNAFLLINVFKLVINERIQTNSGN